MLAAIQYRWQWQYWLWFLLDSVIGFCLKYWTTNISFDSGRILWYVRWEFQLLKRFPDSIQIKSLKSCYIHNKCLWFLFIRFLVVVVVVCGKKVDNRCIIYYHRILLHIYWKLLCAGALFANAIIFNLNLFIKKRNIMKMEGTFFRAVLQIFCLLSFLFGIKPLNEIS